MSKKFLITVNIITILLLIALFVFLNRPLDKEVDYLGVHEPQDVTNILKIDNKKESNYYYSSVYSTKAKTVLDNIALDNSNKYYRDTNDTNETENSSYNPNATYLDKNEDEMEYLNGITDKSFNNAIYQGYKLNGKEDLLEIKYKGLLVNQVYYVNRNIHNNDVILSVDNQVFENSKDLARYIASLNKDNVEVELMRKSQKINVNEALYNVEGINTLALSLSEYEYIKVPKNIYISSNNVYGDSAGLITSLYVYDTLNKEFNSNLKVTGTGAIDKDGNVYQVGSVDLKIEGSLNQNFDVFFVPKDITEYDNNEKVAYEYLEKHNIPKDYIYPISNISEAIEYLKTHNK